jgi:hypothetical protein
MTPAPTSWWERVRGRVAPWWPHHRSPRFVRRTHVHCPRTGELVELDIAVGHSMAERHVLRCSAHPERPPRCEQECRFVPETFLGPADVLIILPEGCPDAEERD